MEVSIQRAHGKIKAHLDFTYRLQRPEIEAVLLKRVETR